MRSTDCHLLVSDMKSEQSRAELSEDVVRELLLLHRHSVLVVARNIG